MEDLKDIITKGILQDIYLLEKAFELNKEINNCYKNVTVGIKRDISDILYHLTYTEMVMCLGRLIDSPNKKYPTICLKGLYSMLKTTDFGDTILEYRFDALRELLCFEGKTSFIDLLNESNSIDYKRRLLLHFEHQEMNEPIFQSIEKIKLLRDKTIAHRENIEIDKLLPYSDIEILLRHSKKVISILLLAFTGTHLSFNGDFYLSRDWNTWRLIYDKFKDN